MACQTCGTDFEIGWPDPKALPLDLIDLFKGYTQSKSAREHRQEWLLNHLQGNMRLGCALCGLIRCVLLRTAETLKLENFYNDDWCNLALNLRDETFSIEIHSDWVNLDASRVHNYEEMGSLSVFLCSYSQFFPSLPCCFVYCLFIHINLLDTQGDSRRACPRLLTYTPIPSEGGSPSSLGVISRLLSECRTTHDRCSKSTEAKARLEHPIRLLDLGHDLPKLTEFEKDRGSVVKYVALSHCWGPTQFVTTLLGSENKPGNLKQHQAGIDIMSLPKNFQDAIKVARYLKFDYIWIDSLCILQDSDNDWKAQSSQMAHVCKYTFLLAQYRIQDFIAQSDDTKTAMPNLL